MNVEYKSILDEQGLLSRLIKSSEEGLEIVEVTKREKNGDIIGFNYDKGGLLTIFDGDPFYYKKHCDIENRPFAAIKTCGANMKVLNIARSILQEKYDENPEEGLNTKSRLTSRRFSFLKNKIHQAKNEAIKKVLINYENIKIILVQHDKGDYVVIKSEEGDLVGRIPVNILTNKMNIYIEDLDFEYGEDEFLAVGEDKE